MHHLQELIVVLRRNDATVNGLLEFLFPARASLCFGVLLVAHALALRRRNHGQSVFLANLITELPHLTVGLLIAPVRMEVHIVDGIEDNMIMTMPLVYVGCDHIFVLAFEPFVCELLADLMSLFRCDFAHIKRLNEVSGDHLRHLHTLLDGKVTQDIAVKMAEEEFIKSLTSREKDVYTFCIKMGREQSVYAEKTGLSISRVCKIVAAIRKKAKIFF